MGSNKITVMANVLKCCPYRSMAIKSLLKMCASFPVFMCGVNMSCVHSEAFTLGVLMQIYLKFGKARDIFTG